MIQGLVGGLLLVVYGILAYFRPKYALFLILVALPAYQIRFQFLKIPFTFLEAMILILFVCWLIEKINPASAGQNLKCNNWFWLICLWLLVATISMFVAPDLRAAAGIWKAYFIEPILLLIVFVSLIKNKKDLNLTLSALVFSGFYISIWAVGQKFFGGGVWSLEVWGQAKIWRAIGPFPQPNFLGLYLGPIILLGLGQIIFYFHKKNILFIVYNLLFIVSAFLALILARSEGAILGVAAGLIFLGLIYKPVRLWTISVLIVLSLIISFCSGPRDYILEKAFLKDLSGQLRLNIWQGAVDLIKTQPVLGVGLSGYQKLIPDYQKRFYHPQTGELISVETHPYPHNIFLTFWLELGLAGLIVFLWTLVKFFCDGFRLIKKERFFNFSFLIFNLAAMISLLIHGCVDTPYFKNDLSVLFWLIIGLGIIAGSFKEGRLKGEKNNSTAFEM